MLEPLLHIFNTSLQTGVFPKLWKCALVVPVFKSGSRLTLTNYRPISKLCAFGKLFEYVVFAVLDPWVNTFLSDCQFGFTSGRSVEMNLVSFMHDIIPEFTSRGQFDAAYLDIAKAFDIVDHVILLYKFKCYGLDVRFGIWLASYLRGRVFRVSCNGVCSNIEYVVESGVPQGSVLGPLLFKAFINDLILKLISVTKLLFADDSKVGRAIRCWADCELLQHSLDIIYAWMVSNRMRLNASKCTVMSFTRKTNWLCYTYRLNGVVLTRCTSQRDLGVIFQSSLLFRDHIEKCVADCNRYLGVLYRLLWFFNSWTPLVLLYILLVRSRIIFASIVWAGSAKYLLNKLESLQIRFVKMIHKRFFSSLPFNYTMLLKELGLLTVCNSLVQLDVLFLYRLLNGQIYCCQLLEDVDFCVVRNTRDCSLFYVSDLNRTISRMCTSFNLLSDRLDLFGMFEFEFRRVLFNLLTVR